MAEALEWFQCKSCGRRQRWAAEIAGKFISCSCGASIQCPMGVVLTESMSGRSSAGSFTDTIIEDTDSPSAQAPLDPFESFEEIDVVAHAAAQPLSMEEVKSTKSFYIWFGMMLFGLSMLIHAIITQWPVYIVMAAIIAPISFWKFHKARRRWQKGRPFWSTLVRSLGGD